jgi:hypothetical protein
MTTQTIRANHTTQGWTFPSFGRFFAVVMEWVDAYSEALEQAHAARQRYPFAAE